MAGETTDKRKRRLEGVEPRNPLEGLPSQLSLGMSQDEGYRHMFTLYERLWLLAEELRAEREISESEEPRYTFITDDETTDRIYVVHLPDGRTVGKYVLKYADPEHECRPPRWVFFREEWEFWSCRSCDQKWVLLREGGPGSKKAWNEYIPLEGGDQ